MFIVMTSSAKMPSSVKASYRNVAVVETDGINMPKQIHPRHKAVKRIVWFRGRLFEGTTDRCAYAVALAEAQAVADRLNNVLTFRCNPAEQSDT